MIDIDTSHFHGLAKCTSVLSPYPAGQERYRCLSRAYLKGCQAGGGAEVVQGDAVLQGCVVVADLTRPSTLDQVAVWKQDVDTKCGLLPALLLANKVVLPHHTIEDIQQ